MGYRPDGLRAWKQAGNGPTTYFFYDGDRLAFEVTPDTAPHPPQIRIYGWGAAGLEEVDRSDYRGNLTLFYAFDPQGNVVSHVKDTGEVLDLACYDAFGQGIGDWAYNVNHPAPYDGEALVGWGGQWGAYTDVLSAGPGQMGLILLTHRYYNPDTGRFLTRDPIGYEGGVNVYAYTRNNPVNRNDPSGYDFLGWNKGEWQGAGMYLWNTALDLLPAPTPIPIPMGMLGLLDRFKYHISEGSSESRGYNDMHNYLGIAMAMGGGPEGESAGFKPLAGFEASIRSFFDSPCFIAGTLVQVPATEETPTLLANNDTANPEMTFPLLGLPVTTKSIEQIRSGDKVATRDPETGKTEFKRVVTTKVHSTDTLVLLALADKATGKVVETITTTPQHPFYVAGKGFTAAINLALGNAIVTRAGPALIVQSITPQAHPEGVLVYNFEVEDDHTYFVGTANGGIWVHNDCFTRVGRWMSQGEYDVMVAEGKVASTRGGLDAKSVTNPPSAGAFRAAAPGSVFVEFDVPTASLAQGGKSGWSTVYGPNSVYGRLAAKRGNPVTGMPEARNIIIRTRN